MVTDMYCPHCGFRLWESTYKGEIEPGRYWCRNLHYWTMTQESGQITLVGDREEA